MVGTIAFKTGSGGKLPPPEKKVHFYFFLQIMQKKLIFTPLSGCKTLSSELRKIFTALFDKKNGALQICPPPPPRFFLFMPRPLSAENERCLDTPCSFRSKSNDEILTFKIY